MNVALDTNIVVYALAGDEEAAAKSTRALEEAASQGGTVVVSAPVYAELLAIPRSTKRDLDAFMADAKIRVDWHLSEGCWSCRNRFRRARRSAESSKDPGSPGAFWLITSFARTRWKLAAC